MDTLTHIALGACIGELFTDKTFGKRAMLWGALAQSIPDIDFISALWLDPTAALLAHRGFTHSILFGILISFFLAITAERFHRPHNISLKTWFLFIGTEIAVHLCLDGFNNYGVGWLEPFSSKRFSFQVLYVADPFFSIASGIACLYLLFKPSDHIKRRIWAKIAITITSLYLLYATVNKLYIEADVQRLTQKQKILYDQLLTTPSPLNSWLHFVVLKKEDHFLIGYHSVFDKDDSISLHPFLQHDEWLQPIRDHQEVQHLKAFSQGFYIIDQKKDTLVFNDLRFGQEIGWYDPTASFAFHYYLNHPEDNHLVVQRGRFAKWNKETVRALVTKIAGY